MILIIYITLGIILITLVTAFWWVKGQPLDWDSSTRRRGIWPGSNPDIGPPRKW
jgi:hypothetical protein